MQSRGDVSVSHNGVPETSELCESYNDVRTSNAKVRAKGASPPAAQGVLHEGPKGRTSSTPSAKFDHVYTQRSNTASSRSTVPRLSEKSNSAITLGCNRVYVSDCDEFDKGDQLRRPSMTPEDFTSSSRQIPSQFDFLMSSAGCEFDKVEFPNNPAPVIQAPAIIAFNRPNSTRVPESSVITGLTTHSARAKFASDRQRPIMSHEALIISPNYGSKFERDGDHNSRSTISHKPSTHCRTNGSQVLSVKVTDKKSICGRHQHCNSSTKPTASCVNKTTERQVSFPRSNSIGVINAQLQKGLRKLDFYKENTAKELEKVQNSTDRILRQNRIEMNQSAVSVSDQSAALPVSQSQPRIRAITSQSAITCTGPDGYKTCGSQQFDITAISEIGRDTSTDRSTDENSTFDYITTGSFQSHLTASTDSTTADSTSTMTRTKQTARREREDRYPRAVRPYVCGVCGHESTQSTNH